MAGARNLTKQTKQKTLGFELAFRWNVSWVGLASKNCEGKPSKWGWLDPSLGTWAGGGHLQPEKSPAPGSSALRPQQPPHPAQPRRGMGKGSDLGLAAARHSGGFQSRRATVKTGNRKRMSARAKLQEKSNNAGFGHCLPFVCVLDEFWAFPASTGKLWDVSTE